MHDQTRDMLKTFHQFRFHILAILLLCLAHGAVGLFGADLPPDAAKLVSQSDADIAKVRVALVKDLGKSLAKYTKAGNLDAANAIKAKVDEVSKLVDEGSDLLGGKPSSPLIGKWSRNGKVWEFLPDNTMIETRDGSTLATGTWQMDGHAMRATLGSYTIVAPVKSVIGDALEVVVTGPGSPGSSSTITRIK